MKRNFFRKNSRKEKRITPEGGLLKIPGQVDFLAGQDPFLGRGPGAGVEIVILAVIAIVIIAILVTGSVKIVDAGHRGVLLNFGAVDTSRSLEEGIHFVIPIRDGIVQMEVRTQRITEDAASASGDLQDVRT